MENFKKHTELQNLKQGKELAIKKSDFDGFEQEVTFNDLVLVKRNRHIGFAGGAEELPFEIIHQIGGVDFYGYKSSYEALGLYLFQLLFSGKSYIHLKLTREQSEIQHVFLHVERNIHQDFQLKSEPVVHLQYKYFREFVEKYPLSGIGFSDRSLQKEDAPIFMFACSDYHNNYHEDSVKFADQLILTLTENGLCALASVFLDMAAAENEQDEICLEHPTLGFGGTGINSLEVRFWLPNSFGFYCERLDDLKF